MQNIVEKEISNPMLESRQRLAGILLHITSLPGKYGIGDLGEAARSFADFLSDAGVSLWQILPLGPTGFGDSPYAAWSSFAGNELLISAELLADDGFIEEAELAQLRDKTARHKAKKHRVDYHFVQLNKLPLLKKAASRFARLSGEAACAFGAGFSAFCRRENYWLDDYALFRVLCEENNDARWHTLWDKPAAKREKDALDKVRAQKKDEILNWKILQYFFECQWQKLKAYVNTKGIRIIGDIPIFTAPDSADSWSRIDLFKTDEEGNYTFVSGVPPDYFSATGQLWGNPVYDWEKLKADGYSWWTDRIRRLLSQVDLFRIDHFRGFDEYWSVPAGNTTAEHGTWEKGPGADLFLELEKKLGKLPILAEDLGFLTDSVIKLREDLGFPGMKVCQFGFTDFKEGLFEARHLFLPHNYSYNWAAYTGTHDNETAAGWFGNLSREEKRSAAAYLNCKAKPADAAWAMVRSVVSSHAKYAIFPIQDILALGNEARINLPSTCSGKNWSWRLDKIPNEKIARRFADLLALYGRRRIEKRAALP